MNHRTFLVTGATKGIGFAISSQLANSGHHVVGVARRTKTDFPGTLATIDLANGKEALPALEIWLPNFPSTASSIT